MPITLADIDLHRIQHLRIDENQTVVEHRIPGADGNVFQNLGRKPVTVTFEGIFQGDEGLEKLQNLRQKFNEGKELSFSSDVATPRDLNLVLLETFKVQEIAGKPKFYQYSMVLKEVVERPTGLPDARVLEDINAEVLDEAGQFLENMEDGLDSLQKMTELKELVDKLSPSIQRLSELVQKLRAN